MLCEEEEVDEWMEGENREGQQPADSSPSLMSAVTQCSNGNKAEEETNKQQAPSVSTLLRSCCQDCNSVFFYSICNCQDARGGVARKM